MFFRKPEVLFRTDPEMYGIIPEPVPSRSYIPDWYKKIDSYYTQERDGLPWKERTIKRCPPVLDAMVTGWILKTAAEIKIVVQDDGGGVSWSTNAEFSVIEPHSSDQIKGHPDLPKPPLKFINYWHMKTPPGWSTLFTPLLNRKQEFFTPMSGIVETDKHLACVNFPSFVTKEDGSYIIPQGTPIVQAIPFKRDFSKKAEIRAYTSEETLKRNRNTRIHQGNPSHYRDTQWEKK